MATVVVKRDKNTAKKVSLSWERERERAWAWSDEEEEEIFCK